MNTSPPRPSRSPNTETEALRAALRKVFWRHNVMNAFRSLGSTSHKIELRHIYSAAEIAEIAFADSIPGIPSHDTITFFLAPLIIGDELWCGVTGCLNDSPEIRIIEPFLVPNRNMTAVPPFREEF